MIGQRRSQQYNNFKTDRELVNSSGISCAIYSTGGCFSPKKRFLLTLTGECSPTTINQLFTAHLLRYRTVDSEYQKCPKFNPQISEKQQKMTFFDFGDNSPEYESPNRSYFYHITNNRSLPIYTINDFVPKGPVFYKTQFLKRHFDF